MKKPSITNSTTENGQKKGGAIQQSRAKYSLSGTCNQDTWKSEEKNKNLITRNLKKADRKTRMYREVGKRAKSRRKNRAVLKNYLEEYLSSLIQGKSEGFAAPR